MAVLLVFAPEILSGSGETATSSFLLRSTRNGTFPNPGATVVKPHDHRPRSSRYAFPAGNGSLALVDHLRKSRGRARKVHKANANQQCQASRTATVEHKAAAGFSQ